MALKINRNPGNFTLQVPQKELRGCSTTSERENGNCNELSSTDGLETELSFPRLSFPIPAPVRHSLRASRVTFPGKWVVIFPSSPRCSNSLVFDVMGIFAFHPNPIWLQFPPVPHLCRDRICLPWKHHSGGHGNEFPDSLGSRNSRQEQKGAA